jgi:hypothetical protein
MCVAEVMSTSTTGSPNVGVDRDRTRGDAVAVFEQLVAWQPPGGLLGRRASGQDRLPHELPIQGAAPVAAAASVSVGIVIN